MRNPETSQEFCKWFRECEEAGTTEAHQWAVDNYEKYTDLRIAKLKDYPRDWFKKGEKENTAEWQHFFITSLLLLFRQDRVDEHDYHGDFDTVRYWDAFCDYFKVTRADLYAKRLKEIEAFLEETIEDDDSTKEDIQGAYEHVKEARQFYHDARNYKILLEKHKNANLAEGIYDYRLDGLLEKLPENFILDIAEGRPKIINYVMYTMRRKNGPNSRSPTRTAVLRWLEGYRDQPIDGVPPGRQAEAREVMDGVPLERQLEAIATLKAAGKHKVWKPK